jgi:hypothetical protein
MSKSSRFPHITAPVGVLDNSKPFNFPVSIAVAKFGKVGLQYMCKVGSSFWPLFGPGTGVKSVMIELVPGLFCS